MYVGVIEEYVASSVDSSVARIRDSLTIVCSPKKNNNEVTLSIASRYRIQSPQHRELVRFLEHIRNMCSSNQSTGTVMPFP